MKPNLIIKITPEPDGGYDWEIITNETDCDFQGLFSFDGDYLFNEIYDLKLTSRRAPYLLKFYDATMGRDDEYSEGFPTGYWWSTFEYKSAKVGRIRKLQ